MEQRGFVNDHHRFLLRLELDLVETQEKSIEAIEKRIVEVLRPSGEKEAELLESMPGVQDGV